MHLSIVTFAISLIILTQYAWKDITTIENVINGKLNGLVN